jgi:hypothetical protein
MVALLAGCGGHRVDPHRPQLRRVAADVERAQSLLLRKADLRRGFHIFDRFGDQLPNFTGRCGKLSDPDLSAMTETASVSAPLLANTNSGAEYLSSAYIFESPPEAARAQALETGPERVACGTAIIKQRLKLVAPYALEGQTQHLIVRTIGDVSMRARQVILAAKVKNFRFRVETSFIFFRHGRALSELQTFTPLPGKGNVAAQREWSWAVSAAAHRLQHSGF